MGRASNVAIPTATNVAKFFGAEQKRSGSGARARK